MFHHSSQKSIFQRKKTIFNSTDYMKKSLSIKSPQSELEAKIKQSLSLSNKEHQASCFVIPELFYVNQEQRRRKKRLDTAKQKISILSEFGFIPETLSSSTSKMATPKITKSSIKISDLMGKNNTQKIFKSLDLKGIIENEPDLYSNGERKKNNSFGNKAERNLVSKSKYNDICRTVATSNGYRNINKHEESLKKIDHIYKSCDNLLYQSKLTTKTLLSVKKGQLKK